MTTERRFAESGFEVRDVTGGTGSDVVIEGMAARYDTRSQLLADAYGPFVETIARGAFTKTAQEADVRAYFNHDQSKPLGRVSAGTLELDANDDGLAYRATVDHRIGYVSDLIFAMERGDVTQSSFAFRSINDDWDFLEDGTPLRTVRELALFDVSPVSEPAYVDTSSGLSVRSLGQFAEEIAALAVPEEAHQDDNQDDRSTVALADARLTLARLQFRGRL